MDAESGFIVKQGDSTSLRDELDRVFAAFEHATGLQVCFRTLSDRWSCIDGRSVVTASFAAHRSAFCQAAKARADPACIKSDVTDLPTDCSVDEGRVTEPFVRTCHAGADEVLLPLWSDGVLVAVLFVGQFTRDVGVGPTPRALRHLSDTETQHLTRLILPLRSYLVDVLQRLDDLRIEPTVGRRATIETYLRENLSTGPSLPGLASRLGLSRSRASHVVRQLTSRSFQELLEEKRIAVAMDLLVGTNATIAWVASQTGFNDTAYFCRYFKRKVGTTPTAFRKRHWRSLSA